MNFEKFIEKNFPGLNYLSISDERYLPTVIVNDEDRIVDSLSNLFYDQPSSKWKTRQVQTRIQNETIQGTRNLVFGGKFLSVLGLKAGVTVNYSIDYEFENTTSVVFDNAGGGIYENEIRQLIMDLKKSNRSHWREILHEFVAMESIYVETFKISLKRDGKVLTQADIETIKGEISISGDYTWNTNGQMVIQNNKSPFGVRGFSVKRFM